MCARTQLLKRPFYSLRASNRCTDAYNRYDLETVAVAVTAYRACDFWQTSHTVFRAGAVPALKTTHDDNEASDRHSALIAFAEAVAAATAKNTAGSDSDVERARSVLLAAGGGNQAIVVEAASTIAFFEMITKIVDATGRAPLPSPLLSVMHCIMVAARSIASMVFVVADKGK
jgi:alkylhydroperoxidase family enzyme